jgi:hypothetical protein
MAWDLLSAAEARDRSMKKMTASLLIASGYTYEESAELESAGIGGTGELAPADRRSADRPIPCNLPASSNTPI